MACVRRSRPCLAEPPAESPSTMKISTERRILLLAVRELAGQSGDVERALATRQLARLARGLARTRGLDDLADDGLGFLADARAETRASLCTDGLSTTPFTSDETSLSLVCEENFGSGSFTERMAVSPSRAVVARGRDLLLLGRHLLLDVVVQRARERRAEAGEMRAAVLLRDVVRVAEHALRYRNRSIASPLRPLIVPSWVRNQKTVSWMPARERFRYFTNACRPPCMLEHVGLVLALVDELDAHAGVQEGQLAQALGQDVVVEL